MLMRDWVDEVEDCRGLVEGIEDEALTADWML